MTTITFTIIPANKTAKILKGFMRYAEGMTLPPAGFNPNLTIEPFFRLILMHVLSQPKVISLTGTPNIR
jgi:hypothetical protein